MMREIIWKRLPSLYVDVPALRPRTVGAYAFAFVAVALGLPRCCGSLSILMLWASSSLRSLPQL
jgi:hypothetical protein